MRALDLAIEMGRRRTNRPELDRRVFLPLLNAQRKELATAVRLHTLNGKGHFFHDALEKSNRVNAVAARKQAEHPVPAAIVHCDVVVQTWRNLADIHLDAVAGNGTAIALRHALAPTPLGEPRRIVSSQYFVNRRQTESDLVQAN